MNILSTIHYYKQQKKPLLVVLVDPEKEQANRGLLPYLQYVDMVFVGGSTGNGVTDTIAMLRKHTQARLVLFPGNVSQFTSDADALLFLSLLNAQTVDSLIIPHIHVAMSVLESHIETIPMGYILLDGGRTSSVEIATKCTPLSQKKIDSVVSTAVAGQLLGKQLIYLEAGSGAQIPVSTDIISAVRAKLQVPLIVGGGICTPEAMMQAFEAGADIVVIGNHFEQHPDEIDDFVRIKRERYGE